MYYIYGMKINMMFSSLTVFDISVLILFTFQYSTKLYKLF